MKITVMTGREMLLEFLKDRPNATFGVVKEDNVFTMYEHMGQKIFFEGVKTSFDNEVVIVDINSDFTEGRGPMRFHKAFRDVEKAIEYIMSQDGIYGSTQGARNYPGVNVVGRPYIISSFNGYDIKIVKLE